MRTKQTGRTGTSEPEIFGRVFANGNQAMTPKLARYILGLGFSEADKARMHELAVKNQEGRASAAEQDELDNDLKVGNLLALLQSKTRQFRKKVE